MAHSQAQDLKNARLDELSITNPQPPNDPPPPYSYDCPATSSSIANDNVIDNVNCNVNCNDKDILSPTPPAANPGLLASKQAHPPLLQSASSHSIPPPPRSPSDPRRTLLLVYIHGFYGNDQSFRAFPAHVHHHLASFPSLSRTHVVHSKVYPRYKTYKAIDVARDNFSAWLEPHESSTTDVILLGHSMGGLLAAEVVLKPSEVLSPSPFKHRILGTVSFDAPFLGLHPGIVASGISSLFRGADPLDPGPQDPASLAPEPLPFANAVATGSSSSLLADPNFNPPYVNDAPFRERSLLGRIVNFASKHSSEGIFNAMGHHIADHLEFGGSLADYRGLTTRYDRVRALEDVDYRGPSPPGLLQPRVRFVNYYTLCSGRPKASKSFPADSHAPNAEDAARTQTSTQTSTEIPTTTTTSTETLTKTATILTEASPSVFSNSSTLSLQNLDPKPITDDEESISIADQDREDPQPTASASPPSPSQSGLSLPLPPPPLPLPPNKPEPPDFEQYQDKESRKQAEREFARVEKAYARDLKDHEKTLRERQKLVDKQRKQAERQVEKEQKEARKQVERQLKEERKQAEKVLEEERKQASEESNEQKKQLAGKLKAELPKADEQSLEERKQADKESEADFKQAKKDAKEERKQIEKALKEERKRLEKTEKEARKQAKKEAKHSASLLSPDCATSASTTTLGTIDRSASANIQQPPDAARTPPKLYKFCTTPRKINGLPDPTWPHVFIDGVDEVGAHSGLFVAGQPHYDGFVRDVAERIVGWVEQAGGRT